MKRALQLVGIGAVAVTLWLAALLLPRFAQAPAATVYDSAYPIPGTGITVGYPSQGFHGEGVRLGYSHAVSFSSLQVRGHIYVLTPPIREPSAQIAVYETEGHDDLPSFLAMLEERQMPGIVAAGEYRHVGGRVYFVWSDVNAHTAVTLSDGTAVVVMVQDNVDADSLLRDMLLNLDFDCRENCTVGETMPTFVGKPLEVDPGWTTAIDDRCRVAVPHPVTWVNASYLGGIDLRSPEDVMRNDEYDRTHPEPTDYPGEGGALCLHARQLIVQCHPDAASFIRGFEGFLAKPELATRSTLADFFADGTVKVGTGSQTVVSTFKIDGQTAYEIREVNYRPYDGLRIETYSVLVEKGRVYSFELGRDSLSKKDEVTQKVIRAAHFLPQ